MELDFKLVRNTLVVRIKGELDMLVTDSMRKAIDKQLEEQKITNLILNLEKVTFIDSSGLGVIIGRYKKLAAMNGTMYIVGASPSVQKILTFSGINKLVPLHKSEQDIMNI